MTSFIFQNKSIYKIIYTFEVIILGVIAIYATPAMMFATAAYIFMVSGLMALPNRTKHARLMLSAISIDILLVLVLQLQRDAIGTALKFNLSPYQQLHILFSLMATICYFPMLYLGYKNYKNVASLLQKRWHKNLGIFTFTVRTLGFLLMFSMLKK